MMTSTATSAPADATPYPRAPWYFRDESGRIRDTRRAPLERPWFLIREESATGGPPTEITATAITGTEGSGWGATPLRIHYTDLAGRARVHEAYKPGHVSVRVVPAQEPAFRAGDRISDDVGRGIIVVACVRPDGHWRYRVQEQGMWTFPGDEHWSAEHEITSPIPARD